MGAEAFVLFEILRDWGAHPRLRLYRRNTGVGFFNDAGPCRKSDPGARPVQFNPPGAADIGGLFLPHGRCLEIETKSLTGRQSKDQIVWQRMIESFGGVYILAREPQDVARRLAAEGITR